MDKDLLEEYNRKRDFKLTKEPSGKKKVAKTKSKKLIFVVQEHHASRLHYDFRLELEGVLKSWAVPKGPSLDPADKRLAVQTEDHPIPYAKFHGSIPQGEYGGGEVFIWDSGTWEPIDEDPIAALKKGHIKFKLKGKKLNGSFVLVRTHYKGSSDKNWLLIKHHDENEVSGFQLEAMAEGSTKKKASKKVSKKKEAPLGKDKWPGFIPPQLPRLVTEVPEEDGNWIHEMKFDGYRMQGHLKNGIAHFYTRNALDWSNTFPHLLNALESLPTTNAIFDGEIVALDEKGRTHFQKLQNSLKSKNDSHLVYYIFDILFLNGQDLRELTLLERKEILEKVLKNAPQNIVYSEHFTENGKEFYQVSCENELEGIISKLGDTPYSSGRNDFWVKTKCSMRQEFVIGGWSEPRGGRTGLGALLLGVYEEGKLRYAGRVGTGFDNKMLRDIKDQLSVIEAKESPFEVNSPRDRDVHWVKPSKVCEVSFGNWTEEGILRTPVFKGMRADKPAKDIGMEKAKKTPKKKHLSMVKEISSPDKILFKEEGITKKEVSEFYQAIAKEMLPYLKDRPLSLVRCPNGSEGACFFQKHFTGKVPDSFHTFPVEEEKGKGIYLSIDSAAGLQELVQLNAFEIHAWNCDKDDYLRPNQIVMDFDPGPGVPWKEVVDAAYELKEMLEDLDLVSFVKLTGGKGIHVHIPIAPIYDWDSIKSFSQSIAQELVARNPSKYVANMSKKLRNKKIFVDYLRNGYGATAVVPYSLRAKPLSAIAIPLEWSELKKLKGPQDYTIKKALKKIKSRAKDPWAGMLKMKQKISILKPVKNAKSA
jgi:bifunctional non-homologous end joining protein LigD